jgi:simple sugar transport system permease protein
MTATTTDRAPGTLRRRIVSVVTRSDGAADALAGAGALVVALLVGALLIAVVGKDVPAAFHAMFSGAFGSEQNVANTLVETIPLALVGVGVSLSFRADLFNVGAEGQLLMGGLAAALTGSALPSAPAAVVLPAMVVAAMAAGACWARLLKVFLGANEMLNTIMLNYAALYL